MIRSALFLAWFIGLTIVMGILFLPVLALPRRAAARLGDNWCRLTLWGLKIFARLGMRVEGEIPQGAVLVAAKHMSMWDTLALYLVLDDPAFVLKRELLRIPFYGWYLGRAAAIAIDRSAGAEALRRMTRAARAVLDEGRPIVIFPEGTRKKPGMAPDYKPGVAALYGQLGIPCVPVALDSGRFWQGFRKYPGTITLRFLEPIPPGLKRAQFMPLLESRIEEATARLLARTP